MFSQGRNSPSAKDDLGQMPSSNGEFTEQLLTRTFRQQSRSMPSRFVSIFRLSMVQLSTPVARMPNHPPCWMVKSRRMTLRQSFSAIALLPIPLSFSFEATSAPESSFGIAEALVAFGFFRGCD